MQTGYSLDDVGGALPWSALGAFLHRIDPASAVAHDIEPDVAAFSGTFKTNAILADIYDILAQINANLVAGFSRRHATKPKRYPRPGDGDKRRIGKDGVTISELDSWFAKKKQQKRGGAGG